MPGGDRSAVVVAAALRALFIGLLAGALAFAPRAQADDRISPLDREWLLGFPRNVARLVTEPLSWEREAWLKAGSVGAGIGALLLVDDPVRDAVQDARSDATDDLADVIRPFGDLGAGAAGTLATYAAGEIVDQPRLERVGLNGFQALLIAKGLAQVVKHVSGRERPEAGGNPFDFEGPTADDENHAFVSGHASAAFALATVVAEEYDNVPWVPWAAYGVALGTGLSRINDDDHWASDVAAGAVLGYGIAKVVSAYSPFHEDREQFRIAPLIRSGALGLRLTASF